MVEEIAKDLSRDTWYSTQETAYSLMALSSYYGGSPANPFRFKVAWDKEAAEEIAATVPFFQKLYSPFHGQGTETDGQQSRAEPTLPDDLQIRDSPGRQ